MRKILGELGSKERHTFQANFGKYGYKRYHDMSCGDLYSPTMVVRNVEIVDDPEHPKMITDHLWLNLTKGFAQLGLLKEGDRLQFNGRVSEYSKGFINKDKKDYELTYPTKIKLITDSTTLPLPEDHQSLIGMIMNLNYKFYHNMGRPLVPYFMDAFAKWQKEQDNPLPIKCHQGNDFESSIKYDELDYQTEKADLEKQKQELEERHLRQQETGLEIIKSNTRLANDLVQFWKKLTATEQNAALKKYCYISNSKLSNLIEKYNLSKIDQINIKQALTSDWFHEQFEGKAKQELSPLEQLAKKFNQ